MTPLREALRELLAAHDAVGSPLSRCIRPGRPPDEVRSRLAELGLTAPDELVDWYNWGEPDRRAWEAAGAPAGPHLFWAGDMITFDRALEIYHSYEERYAVPGAVVHGVIDADGNDTEWDSTWFPVINSSPDDIVIESAGAARVRRVVSVPGYSDGPPAPVIFASILELVQAAVRSVRDHYYWDGMSLQPRDPYDARNIEQY